MDPTVRGDDRTPRGSRSARAAGDSGAAAQLLLSQLLPRRLRFAGG